MLKVKCHRTRVQFPPPPNNIKKIFTLAEKKSNNLPMKGKNHLFFTACKSRVVETLSEIIPLTSFQSNPLQRAIKYSVLNGGKRIRPLLLYTVGYSLGKTLEELDLLAACVELIHCYSLVHDDMPSMDDDNYRRGMLSCHAAFNESTAILVGDALQSVAFSLIRDEKIISILGQAIGSEGLVGGQYIDLSGKQAENLFQLKTGSLIEASIMIGVIAADCKDVMIIDTLKQLAQKVGILFQIQDDMFDKNIYCKDLYNTNRRNFVRNYEEVMKGLDILPFKTSLIKELYNNIIYTINDLQILSKSAL